MMRRRTLEITPAGCNCMGWQSTFHVGSKARLAKLALRPVTVLKGCRQISMPDHHQFAA